MPVGNPRPLLLASADGPGVPGTEQRKGNKRKGSYLAWRWGQVLLHGGAAEVSQGHTVRPAGATTHT
eukprot:1158789-Pelagomonas_calceolata.AAC.9